MKFVAKKVHVKGGVEIRAPFILLLIFSQLSGKVSDADLSRAKEMSSWDHKGSPRSLHVQGERQSENFMWVHVCSLEVKAAKQCQRGSMVLWVLIIAK